MVVYNALPVVRDTMHAAHGEADQSHFSTYCHTGNCLNPHCNSLVIEDFCMNAYVSPTPSQMAGELKRIARYIRLSKYKKGNEANETM